MRPGLKIDYWRFIMCFFNTYLLYGATIARLNHHRLVSFTLKCAREIIHDAQVQFSYSVSIFWTRPGLKNDYWRFLMCFFNSLLTLWRYHCTIKTPQAGIFYLEMCYGDHRSHASTIFVQYCHILDEAWPQNRLLTIYNVLFQ